MVTSPSRLLLLVWVFSTHARTSDHTQLSPDVVYRMLSDVAGVIEDIKVLVSTVEYLGGAVSRLERRLDEQQNNPYSLTRGDVKELTSRVANVTRDVLRDVGCAMAVGGWGRVTGRPRDCQDVATEAVGAAASGVYTLHLTQPATGETAPVQAYCELDRDDSWLIIQRRTDGQEDFSRNWAEYETGFGDLSKDFWWGNQNIHRLTAQGAYRLKIELEDWTGATKSALYTKFTLADGTAGYVLDYDHYDGTSSLLDSLSFPHKGAKFTTHDQDNDGNRELNCASKWSGGWWYGNCFNVNLNGRYVQGGESPGRWDGIIWVGWRGSSYSYRTVSMKIQRMM